MEAEGLQLSLFDEQGLAEITTAVYPGERIVLCRNPLRARESAYNRERLLAVKRRANSYQVHRYTEMAMGKS